MVTVSIIIPVYNVEKYLSKCIDSIRWQTEKNWELILVDDGSNDSSKEICDSYARNDARIKVVHKPNGGVSSARNVGMKIAKGRYICFVDSDDWVEQDYISSMLKYVEDERTVVYGNINHDYNGICPNRIEFNYIDGYYENETNYANFMLDHKIIESGYPVAKLFCKAIIDEYSLEFDTSISFHEDHLFVLNYLMHTTGIILSSNASYHYMHRKNNTSLSQKRHPVKNMIIASNKLINIIKAIIDKYQINNVPYTKHLYTILGLNQLVGTALSASKDEIRIVGNAIREKKDLFKMYYSPNHVYVKIIPGLFFLNLDLAVLWISKSISGKLI